MDMTFDFYQHENHHVDESMLSKEDRNKIEVRQTALILRGLKPISYEQLDGLKGEGDRGCHQPEDLMRAQILAFKNANLTEQQTQDWHDVWMEFNLRDETYRASRKAKRGHGGSRAGNERVTSE